MNLDFLKSPMDGSRSPAGRPCGTLAVSASALLPARSRNGAMRAARRWTAAALLSLCALLLYAPGALAQMTPTPTTFVSNVGQTDSSAGAIAGTSIHRAQQFQTGSNPGGYTLAEIVVNIRAARTGTPAFALYTSTAGDRPGTEVVGLSGDSSTAGEQSFTPDEATALSASTKYFIVFLTTSGQANLQRTASDNVDTGASTGWDIADSSLFSSDSGATWSTSSPSVEIAVKGTATTTNTDPMGAPTITGTAQVGQTLTAVTSGITDADGLATPNYTYQWIRVNGTDADISMATSSTYTPVAADVGKTLKVRVSFTDDGGTTETLTSAETAAVTAAAAAATCAAPTLTGQRQIWTGTVTVGALEVLGSVQAYGFSSTGSFGSLDDTTFSVGTNEYTVDAAAVAAGTGSTVGDLQFSLTGALAAEDLAQLTVHVCDESFAFSVATLNSTEHTYRWSGSALDWSPPVTSRTLYLSVPAPNADPTGAPTITGTAQVGQTLTAVTSGITDADGLTTPNYTYQWIRVNGTDADISSATSSTYTPVAADVGKTLKVRVSFTDDAGTTETLTSAETATVTAAAAATCAAPTLTGQRQIWTGEVTVGVITGGGDTQYHGFNPGTSSGNLDDTTFSVGTNNYTVDFVVVGAPGRTDAGSLNFSLTGELEAADLAQLTLHVCDDSFAFSDAMFGSTVFTYFWPSADLDWSPPVTSRTLYLSVANADPSGAPTVTGTAQVGQTLTAVTSGITDADGLTTPNYTYQWIRVNGSDTDIEDADESTYTPVAADVGKTLKVRVSFTDDGGTTETLTSAETATVTAAGTPATAPTVSGVAVTSTPASGDTYGTGEKIEFTVTFDQAVTVTGTPEFHFCLGSSSTMSCTDGTPPPALRIAAFESGSGTTALVFSYTVVVGDVDDNGIWIGAQDRTIKLGTGDAIQGTVGGLDAVLTHAEQGTRSGHKVNGEAASDTTAPTVRSIVRLMPTTSPTNADSVAWRVRFSENVKGVDAADFTVSGTTAPAAVEAVSGSTSRYVVTATGGNLAGLNGTVTLGFATAQNIKDDADNALTDTTPTGANDNTFVLDNIAPTVTISGVPEGSRGLFTATFTFSEGVTGFALADIAVGNGTRSGFTGEDGDRRYTARIMPTANGPVTVDVAADAATDAAGNGNTAAAQASSTYTALPAAGCAAPDFSGRDVVWSGTVLMGAEDDNIFGAVLSHGYIQGDHNSPIDGREGFGGLSGETFTVGGNTYTVTGLEVASVPGSEISIVASDVAGDLRFSVSNLVTNASGETETFTKATRKALKDLGLHVCDGRYDFSAGTPPDSIEAGGYWEWRASLDWSGVSTRRVHLSLPAAMTGLQIAGAEAAQVEGAPQVGGAGEDGQWTEGETVEVRLTFNRAVDVDTSGGTPSIELSLGASKARQATFARGSGTTELVFAYTLVAGDGSHSAMLVTQDSLALNGGTITTSEGGADAVLTHDGAAVIASPGIEPRDEPGDEGAPTPVLFTAVFELPAHHDGSNSFEFTLTFSEEPDTMSYTDFADGLLQVSGATIARARRKTPGSDIAWIVTIGPSGDSDIAISLPVRPCTDDNAVCADGSPLSQAASASVPRRPLTATLSNVRKEHDGERPFTFRVTFSEEPDVSYKTVRDSMFDMTGGTISQAKRVTPGNNERFDVTVNPAGYGPVSLSLATLPACGQDDSICTPGGLSLQGPLSATVPGPPTLSVADAEADEAASETLDFAVTLSRALDETVTVDYATSDGTATAGSDYTEASGTLTFAAGETSKTVAVPVLDDVLDEGNETLTLTLSNAAPSRVRLADATATGTIENSDAMPQAWIARFGRTVGEQVLDAVESRMRAPRTPGAEVRLGGQRIGLGPVFGADAAPGDEAAAARRARENEAEAAQARRGLAAWLAGETPGSLSGAGDPADRRGAVTRTMTERELLLGSSFALTAGAEGGPGGAVSLWGRTAVSRFDGREGDLAVDGEVVSGLLGADWSRDKAMAGLMLGHSRGEGGYRGEAGGGTVTSTLTGLYPWGRYALSERVSVWGVAGYGEGVLTLTPDGQSPIRTDLDLLLAAAGLRGVVVQAPATGGPELAVKTDAMGVRTTTAKVRGLGAAEAEVTRLRLGLEGSWAMRFEGGGTLTPSLEIGVRHDGGDAETGFGADIGGGVAWSDPKRGLSAEFRGRGLLSHEAAGFRERGLSGSLSFDPRPDSTLGLALTLSQTVGGASRGGVDALLGRGTLEGLAANDNGGEFANRRFEVRLGYGIAALGDRFTMTPELGVGLSNGSRDYSLGWRLARETRRGDIGSLALALEARRHENDNDAGPPRHEVGLRLTARY